MAGIKEVCLLLFAGFFVLTSADPFIGRYKGYRSRFLCLFKRCHRYAKCEIQNNKAVCVCPKACQKNFSPVCGTDLKTYSNLCVLARTSCVANSRLRRGYSGPCKSGSCRGTPWRRLRCPYYSRCEIVYGLPRCSCPKTCSFRYRPVCGSDDRTYRNSCELKKKACKERKWLHVQHPGHCRPDPCARIDCCCGGQCKVNETNHARCACDFACTLQFDPVCGSDNRTYGNACGLRSAACAQQNPRLRVASKGRCKNVTTAPPVVTTTPPFITTITPCAAIRCGFFSTCEVINGTAGCVCPSLCPVVIKRVCGSNGVTYENLCELKRDSCKNSRFIEVASQGPCPTRNPTPI